MLKSPKTALTFPHMKMFLLLVALAAQALAFEIPARSQQIVVGIAENWNSNTANVQIFERRGNGAWTPVSKPWPARLGAAGLAWGLGIHPNPADAKTKREGDKRAPAGVFYIGGAWGYHANIQKHPRLPYKQVTSRDMWIEDVQSPKYNSHAVLPHEPQTPWEIKQQMKQNDYPHSLKLFIAHNPPPRPMIGAGSAIFFHIWRGGGSKATAGCTTMAEPNLRTLIARIDPGKMPLYVLLPKAEYQNLRASWKLP